MYLAASVISKKAAIHLAIATQLAIEDKAPLDLRGTLGANPLTVPGAIDANATPEQVRAHVRALRDFAEGLRTGSGGPGYAENPARNFLAKVAFLLRADDPPLKFNWSKINPAAALQCQLYALIDMIALETVFLEEQRTDEKQADKK